MAAQLQASGIEVKVDAESYPNDRFARLHDPEGNPIELSQPKVPDTKRYVAKRSSRKSLTRATAVGVASEA